MQLTYEMIYIYIYIIFLHYVCYAFSLYDIFVLTSSITQNLHHLFLYYRDVPSVSNSKFKVVNLRGFFPDAMERVPSDTHPMWFFHSPWILQVVVG